MAVTDAEKQQLAAMAARLEEVPTSQTPKPERKLVSDAMAAKELATSNLHKAAGKLEKLKGQVAEEQKRVDSLALDLTMRIEEEKLLFVMRSKVVISNQYLSMLNELK